MRNKKLIPFEVIEKVVAEELEVIDAVLQHYAGRIKYLSTYRGHINDDIQARLKAQFINAILQFRFDRQKVANRAQSDKPLTLSIHYRMLRDRGFYMAFRVRSRQVKGFIPLSSK